LLGVKPRKVKPPEVKPEELKPEDAKGDNARPPHVPRGYLDSTLEGGGLPFN